jgi:hypothetical protein
MAEAHAPAEASGRPVSSESPVEEVEIVSLAESVGDSLRVLMREWDGRSNQRLQEKEAALRKQHSAELKEVTDALAEVQRERDTLREDIKGQEALVSRAIGFVGSKMLHIVGCSHL